MSYGGLRGGGQFLVSEVPLEGSGYELTPTRGSATGRSGCTPRVEVFDVRISGSWFAALEATHGQMDGVFSQLPHKCHLEEVASVGESLKICH